MTRPRSSTASHTLAPEAAQDKHVSHRASHTANDRANRKLTLLRKGMEEEELQDLATAWMWVVRGMAREDGGSPGSHGKAQCHPSGSGTFTGQKSSFSRSTHSYHTPKGGEHSAGPTTEALAVPPLESDHTGQLGLLCQGPADPASCLVPAFSRGL